MVLKIYWKIIEYISYIYNIKSFHEKFPFFQNCTIQTLLLFLNFCCLSFPIPQHNFISIIFQICPTKSYILTYFPTKNQPTLSCPIFPLSKHQYPCYNIYHYHQHQMPSFFFAILLDKLLHCYPNKIWVKLS
jgi:hypothetical protein